MDFSKFFDYPTEEEKKSHPQEARFLFNFTQHDWETFLTYTFSQRFSANMIAVQYMEEDPSLFIVIKGHFDLLIPSSNHKKLHKITTISEGSVFGELSFFDGKPRSATVIANIDGEISKLTRNAFDEMSAKEPALALKFIMELGRLLSLRLRQTTEVLSYLGR